MWIVCRALLVLDFRSLQSQNIYKHIPPRSCIRSPLRSCGARRAGGASRRVSRRRRTTPSGRGLDAPRARTAASRGLALMAASLRTARSQRKVIPVRSARPSRSFACTALRCSQRHDCSRRSARLRLSASAACTASAALGVISHDGNCPRALRTASNWPRLGCRVTLPRCMHGTVKRGQSRKAHTRRLARFRVRWRSAQHAHTQCARTHEEISR